MKNVLSKKVVLFSLQESTLFGGFSCIMYLLRIAFFIIFTDVLD